MSIQDSKAQQEHARENKMKKKANTERNQIIVDKKLEGENRPAE